MASKRVWTVADIEADFAERTAGFKQVEAEVLACTRCRLAQTRTHAVPGEGNFGTLVLFVGEGPGQEEDRQGRPFVGRSGQLLTRNLERLGIKRQDVFITNVVKCRPPDNRDPQPDEISACADYMARQIALINPRILVTLGRISMSRFFPGATITKVHGQVKNIGFGRVAMAMFHPAAALRDPSRMRDFEQDFERLPGLMARALAANEAALRGEALPAGVPHPGDADYVDETTTLGETRLEEEAEASDNASKHGVPGKGEAPVGLLPADADIAEGKPAADGTQLRLF